MSHLFSDHSDYTTLRLHPFPQFVPAPNQTLPCHPRAGFALAAGDVEGVLRDPYIAAGDLLARVRVRDDGIGIEPALLPREGRARHWGLKGMRERARHIRGNWRCRARAAWARKNAWSTLLIQKTAVPSQMTRQLPISQCKYHLPSD